MQTQSNIPQWADLLKAAVSEPGKIAEAYSNFHNYSIGNQMLALIQCQMRGIEPGPISTFMGWKERGRHVKKGEKAITLCMPVSGKRKATVTDDDGNETEIEVGYTRFVYRNNWFVLSQTEGEEYKPASETTDWSEERALTALGVEKVPFEALDGNMQGYATGRKVAVSPLAAMPHKTLFHELAHVVLGHTAEGDLHDDERTPRNIRELEAEATAMLCCASLGLPGVEFSRGYIQAWYSGAEVPEKSAQRIFAAADKILRAGRPAATAEVRS